MISSFEKPINVVRSVSTGSHSSNISIKPTGMANNTQTVVITLTKDEEEYHLSFRDSTSSSTNWNGWVQCEKGNTATAYEQYKEQKYNIYLDQPLRKIGDYEDYIDFEKKQVIRNISHTVLTSDMTWSVYDDVQENVLGFYTNSLPGRLLISRSTALSNRFKRSNSDIAPRAILGIDYEAFYITSNMFKVTVEKTKVTDKQSFLKWLDENQVYIDFVLETSESQTIELPEIQLYKGLNTITVDTDVQPSNMSITYNVKQ